jgi:uncharacterized protein
MYKRVCNPSKLRSFFLFGARGTGKSTLLETMFSKDESTWFDLNDLETEALITRSPERFEAELQSVLENSPHKKWVVVDEIQKCPSLLNTIHKLITKKHFLFALTGSSARKLKRGAANLLAGRALQNHLFPLTFLELQDDFDLDFCLRWGSLPDVFQLPEPERNQYLRTYVHSYLKEEIQAEQIVRNIPVFRSFIEVAAQSSGKILNYSNVARDVGTDSVTVKNYFSVLEDTLIGFYLPAFHTSVRKRQSKHPKFYFFDLGVCNAAQNLINIGIAPKTSRYGELFESFVIAEIFRLSSYLNLDWTLSYLLTHGGVEVDLVIDRPGQKRALVEIKSTTTVTKDDLKTLFHFTEEFKDSEFFLLSNDSREHKVEHIFCLPWKTGLKKLGLC